MGLSKENYQVTKKFWDISEVAAEIEGQGWELHFEGGVVPIRLIGEIFLFFWNKLHKDSEGTKKNRKSYQVSQEVMRSSITLERAEINDVCTPAPGEVSTLIKLGLLEKVGYILEQGMYPVELGPYITIMALLEKDFLIKDPKEDILQLALPVLSNKDITETKISAKFRVGFDGDIGDKPELKAIAWNKDKVSVTVTNLWVDLLLRPLG